jgi:Zn finger protein HypA/HybF involved in hydrogenase expression
MAQKIFCTTCQRTVYIEEQDTPVCPVCSSPLLESVADESAIDQDEATTKP